MTILSKTLDNPLKLYKHEGKIYTLRELIHIAKHCQIHDRPTHRYNRRKFNNMSKSWAVTDKNGGFYFTSEQEYYENVTLKKRTIEYRLFLNDTLYYNITKPVFEYAKSILPELSKEYIETY